MAENGKIEYVVEPDICDHSGKIIVWPEDSGYDFYDHNPLKRDVFHADLDEVFLEYKAQINRQKSASFAAKADENDAQAAELRACGTPEERKKLVVIRRSENNLADDMGITVERLRELLSVATESS